MFRNYTSLDAPENCARHLGARLPSGRSRPSNFRIRPDSYQPALITTGEPRVSFRWM
jgi:hypothetical protein